MSVDEFDVVAGDTFSLSGAWTSDGSPLDLTGATIGCMLETIGVAALDVSSGVTPTSLSAGLFAFALTPLQTKELPYGGITQLVFRATFSDESVRTLPPIRLNVKIRWPS